MFEDPGYTKLPWLLPKVPIYRTGKYGTWELNKQQIPILRGYFNGIQPFGENYILKKGKKVWMSTTPMELESMAPYIEAAHGHVVVVGGGMGIYLTNVIAKPEVTEVTLIEKDEEVLDFLYKNEMSVTASGNLSKEWTTKLSIIHKDVFDIKNWSEEVDFLYIDIWMTLGTKQALPDTKKIWNIIKSKEIAFWSQEIEFIHWCWEQGFQPPPSKGQVKKWVKSTGAPLYTMKNFEDWSHRAAKNIALM